MLLSSLVLAFSDPLLPGLPAKAYAAPAAKTISWAGSSVSLVSPNTAPQPKKISSVKYSI